MIAIVLLGLVIVAAEEGTPPANVAAYRAAAKGAVRDASAHARLALWCEAHGMSAERVKHLALAVLYDPSNAMARGLMGMVAFKGKWDRPEAVGRRIEGDPAYRALTDEYLERRAKTPMKPDAQAKLAAWCDEKGLREQAIAHYSEVVRLDPRRESAWKHLGYKRQGSRWVKPEDQAADRLEAERQKHADRTWRPKLERIREGLDSRDPARRDRARQAAAEVNDPRAVPMIWAVLLRGNDRSRMAAIAMLGQIDGPLASNALAALAIFNPSAEVRARATEVLSRRDPRDVIGRLIGLVRRPFRYEIRRPNGPGTEGVLFVEGERFNIQRFYLDPPITPGAIPPRLFAPWVPFDPYGGIPNLSQSTVVVNGMVMMPGGPSPAAAEQAARAIVANPGNAGAILKGAGASAGGSFGAGNGLIYDTMVAAAYRDREIAADYQMIQQATRNLQQRLSQDVETVKATNAGISDLNSRVLPVLGLITGQDFGVDPEKWKSWWTDQLGYVYESSDPATKPTYTDTLSVQTPFTVGATHTACFAAGTPVVAIGGPRMIESIQVGDRVLSQDPTTGALGFRPVVAVHRNRPTPTLRVAVEGETVVATGIHRFWKAGQGWVMARDLKPGDRLRVVGETAAVRSIEPDATQPVYNLDVADDRDFFVGARGLLVHDFSFVQPVASPFDREPELAPTTTAPPPQRSMLGPRPIRP